MHNTRRELLDDFVLLMGDTDDEEARNIAEGCLNRALLALWLKLPWRVFRSPVPYALPLVVDQASYALPDYFGRIGPGEVRNATVGGALPRLQDGELERMFPLTGTALEVHGQPRRYEIQGTTGVSTQVAIAGELLEVLSLAPQDNDVVLSISGRNGVGHWTREQVRLGGTTPVQCGTWTYIDEVGKSYEAGATAETEHTTSRGVVTLRQVSDGAIRQQLLPQESARQHDVFTVYPKPQIAHTLLLPIIRKPKRLFQDGDTLPDLWGPAIFERMQIDWQVSEDEMPLAQALTLPAGPALLDLVAFENQQRPVRHKRGFGA